MADNLKPCPFCEGAFGSPRKIGMDEWFIYCQRCHSSGPSGSSKKEAIAAWNRRASPWRESQKEPPPKDEAWMLGRSKLTGIDLFRWCPVDEEWLDGTDMPSERPDWWMPIPPLEGA